MITADSNGGDNTQVEQSVASQVDGGDTQVEPLSPPDIEDPEPILHRHVECYVSGLLAPFPRKTLNKMEHEILILHPQSEYAIEKERPILHQRCGAGGDLMMDVLILHLSGSTLKKCFVSLVITLLPSSVAS